MTYYDDYIATNINKFHLIHSRLRDHIKVYKGDLMKRQYKISKKVDFSVGRLDMVGLHTPVASSNKLSPKFTGPYKIDEKAGGNKHKIRILKH